MPLHTHFKRSQALGATTLETPTVFVGFVSFGIVALLFLVCNELIVEAKAAQGDDEKWWIGSMVFVGIYVVLMLEFLIPE